MEAAEWGSLAVAVVAAVAAVTAAVLSRRSAREAQASADGIDRRRHMIEALDAETESFRAAVLSFYQALYDIDLDQVGMIRIRQLARANIIRAHPLCTPQLDAALSWGIQNLADAAEYAEMSEPDGEMTNVRSELRSVFHHQAGERRSLLAEIKEKRSTHWSISLPFLRVDRRSD